MKFTDKLTFFYALEEKIWKDKIEANQFLGTLSNVKALDVLPYHIMGVTKYKQLDMEYPLEGVPAATSCPPPSPPSGPRSII